MNPGEVTSMPDAIAFALKASQQITHRKRLHEAGDAVSYLFARWARRGAPGRRAAKRSG
jgi:uncharacterized protein YecE (DUF72 family)